MKIRLLILALILAMLTPLLAACGGEETTAPKVPAADTSQQELKESLLLLSDGVDTKYRIVYPMAAPEYESFARELSDLILEKTGAKLEVVHDSKPGSSEYEIRLGRVARNMDALNIYSGFKLKKDLDFAVKVTGNTVYLYGLSQLGIAAAKDYFEAKLLTFGEHGAFCGVAKEHETIYIKEDSRPAVVTGHDDKYVYFSLGMGTVSETFCRLSNTADYGWRLQTKTTASAAFSDVGAAQYLAQSLNEMPPSEVNSISTEEIGGKLYVRTGDATYAVIECDPFKISFYPAGAGEDTPPAAEITDLYASAGGSYVRGTFLDREEAVFGTGERFNSVNQRGRSIDLFTADIWSSDTSCYVGIPMLCFSRGAGVFINRYERMKLDIGKGDKDLWQVTVEGAAMDCYVFATERISDALYGYSNLTGFAGQPEEWTYGMLMCRFSPDLSQKWSADVSWSEDRFTTVVDPETGEKLMPDGRGVGVYDVIAKMEAYDLPWTGVLAEPWGAYTTGKHDDLKELCDYVHSLGKKFLIYISVGGGPVGMHMTGYDVGYFVSRVLPDGTKQIKLPDTQNLNSNNPDNPEGSSRYYLDITNPEAVEWFFDEYWYYLANEVGVDGCKIDFCELMPEDVELNYYDENAPTAGSHHWYPSAFCAMFWDMIDSKADGGMCYIRGGGIGLQRSPYVWAGDQRRMFASLDQQLKAVLSAGLSGVPFVSYDMSGYEYLGGRLTTDTSRLTETGRDLIYESQVFLRGLQFTAFTVCMQTHGTVRWAYEFAEDGDHVYVQNEDGIYVPKKDANGNYVYDTLKKIDQNGNYVRDENGEIVEVKDQYGQPVKVVPGTFAYVTDVYRAYVKLHELLTPYITEYSEIACTTGTPLMRHMVLHWQDDANVYGIDDQYMFGDAFLVCPITNSLNRRTVYLPEGNWKDMNTGEIHNVGAEGKTITVNASITQLPLFYNLDTTSETAPDLLGGIDEIFAYLAEIDAQIPDYIKNYWGN